MRPAGAALRLIFVVLAFVAACPSRGEENGGHRVVLGPPQVVLGDRALGLRYFPDERVAVVRTKPDCRVIVAATVSSYLLEGPALGEFKRAVKVLDKGRPGTFDNGYAGISAVVRAKSGDLLAFYHGEDQEGMKSVGSGIPGFYCRVGLAVSHDDGTTFEKRGPIISSQFPKDPKGHGDQGTGEPWVMAAPGGEFLYAYFTSHEHVDGRGAEICMARCPVADEEKPHAWKKLFAGQFVEPGLGGRDTPLFPEIDREGDTMFPHVIFLPALKQYMMSFCVNEWRETPGGRRTGFYVAFSDDGIHWPQEHIQLFWPVPVLPQTGRELAWHPTFIPDAWNVAHGWLYYGFSESWGDAPPHKPHYMVRRRMTIE